MAHQIRQAMPQSKRLPAALLVPRLHQVVRHTSVVRQRQPQPWAILSQRCRMDSSSLKPRPQFSAARRLGSTISAAQHLAVRLQAAAEEELARMRSLSPCRRQDCPSLSHQPSFHQPLAVVAREVVAREPAAAVANLFGAQLFCLVQRFCQVLFLLFSDLLCRRPLFLSLFHHSQVQAGRSQGNQAAVDRLGSQVEVDILGGLQDIQAVDTVQLAQEDTLVVGSQAVVHQDSLAAENLEEDSHEDLEVDSHAAENQAADSHVVGNLAVVRQDNQVADSHDQEHPARSSRLQRGREDSQGILGRRWLDSNGWGGLLEPLEPSVQTLLRDSCLHLQWKTSFPIQAQRCQRQSSRWLGLPTQMAGLLVAALSTTSHHGYLWNAQKDLQLYLQDETLSARHHVCQVMAMACTSSSRFLFLSLPSFPFLSFFLFLKTLSLIPPSWTPSSGPLRPFWRLSFLLVCPDLFSMSFLFLQIVFSSFYF